MHMTEFRPGSFQILPTAIKNLIIINVLVFLAQSILGDKLGYPITDLFALHCWQSDLFEPWQFITHLFMHGSIGHIFSNMFALVDVRIDIGKFMGTQTFYNILYQSVV